MITYAVFAVFAVWRWSAWQGPRRGQFRAMWPNLLLGVFLLALHMVASLP